ncbi:hypothetical protein B0T20DRAFT_494480 [Sordaria brevicollis]|uniref:Uncharacterized protein n=1 Tax=Sordaria brevicollis TaxID=83679 RepID=A0AAE0PIP6_SORBR|nr:hypothetical protein B0T20DRAFT_494480 [Sordaria brevicollis]
MATISITDHGVLVKIGGTTTIAQKELDGDQNTDEDEHIGDVDNCTDIDSEGPASLDEMSSPFDNITMRHDEFGKQDPTTTTAAAAAVNSHHGFQNRLWAPEQRYVLFFWRNKYRARSRYAHFIPGAQENNAAAVYAFFQRLCSEDEIEGIDQRLRAIKEEINERGSWPGLMCRGVREVFVEWEKEEVQDEDEEDWDVMEVEEEVVEDEEVEDLAVLVSWFNLGIQEK